MKVVVDRDTLSIILSFGSKIKAMLLSVTWSSLLIRQLLSLVLSSGIFESLLRRNKMNKETEIKIEKFREQTAFIG